MYYAVFSEGGYYLYYALRSILCTTQYFRKVYTDYNKEYAVFTLVDTIYIKHYAEFSEGRYYLYYALRSIFVGWILFTLCTTQYFQRVDTIYTMNYAIFSWGGYYLYYELRSIFGG